MHAFCRQELGGKLTVIAKADVIVFTNSLIGVLWSSHFVMASWSTKSKAASHTYVVYPPALHIAVPIRLPSTPTLIDI